MPRLRNRQGRVGRAIRAPVRVWGGHWDSAVATYQDCGLFESGFARVRCPSCKFEFLVAFSCRCRGLCPSCGAKRAAIFAELLQHRILADVPHAQWVFSIPKMLRPYFLYHRELLGDLARLAYETVREMMAAAVDGPDARPGMVAVIQTFSSSLKFNPHIHAIVTRGVFLSNGQWHPIPYVDTHKAELVFRHKLLRFLRDRDLISEERIERARLYSSRHPACSGHGHHSNERLRGVPLPSPAPLQTRRVGRDPCEDLSLSSESDPCRGGSYFPSSHSAKSAP